MEVLIANIKKAEKEKNIYGLRIARTSPSIYLLFADDNLLFVMRKKTDKYGGTFLMEF